MINTDHPHSPLKGFRLVAVFWHPSACKPFSHQVREGLTRLPALPQRLYEYGIHRYSLQLTVPMPSPP